MVIRRDADLPMLETHLLGRGIERACYRDPVDPERCFKVSEKTSCRQTRRDIVFFERLARLGIESSYVPKYLGAFETETKIGFFQECFARPGVRPLSEFMAQCSREALLRTDLALWEMRGELIEKNIVAIDYDTSATKVNQENRIKLMLATARENYGRIKNQEK